MKMTKAVTVFIFVALLVAGGVYYAAKSNLTAQLRNQVTRKMKQDFSTSVIKTVSPSPSKPLKFSFAAVSDVHNNLQGLQTAITNINQSPAEFVIGTGDYSTVGTEAELSEVKKSFQPVKKSLSI
jgi:uncharacterized phage infection (PIP) family protein YhgE